MLESRSLALRSDAAPFRCHILGGSLLLLGILLWVPELRVLWHSWNSDPSLSHGLLVPLIAAGLLWERRESLRRWKAASGSGLALLMASAFVYVLAVWGDIDFLKPLTLIAMLLGVFWFLGGAETLKASAGPLGFLLFMIPWPTTLIDRLAFPLQLASSSYAALFAGILGVPIHREGVQLAVVPVAGGKAVYSIVIAQACSGLTSLLVLLALGYLIAYFTPTSLLRRALLLISMVPLALAANATRLTIILVIGAHHHPQLAKWIHDHEGPVLMLFCSLGLTGLRHLALLKSAPAREEGSAPMLAGEPEREALSSPVSPQPERAARAASASPAGQFNSSAPVASPRAENWSAMFEIAPKPASLIVMGPEDNAESDTRHGRNQDDPRKGRAGNAGKGKAI